MTTMSVVGECFFWYRLTRVVPDKFHRAVKRLCVCVFERFIVSIVWLTLLVKIVVRIVKAVNLGSTAASGEREA